MRHVHIATKSKQYPVYIGSVLEQLTSAVASMKPAVSSVLIMSDDTVAKLYLDEVQQCIPKDVYSFIIPNGEREKSFENYYEAQTCALQNGLDRHALIVALGGGVIGDLAGFVAATYMRGIRFIQIPTTLLAHDSAVGGKVAVNHPLGKNMIGAFHQPEAVFYHTPFLNSLPEEEWRSGFAEVMKHALIWNKEFYHWLQKEISCLQDLREEALMHALEQGIRVKAAVVSQDEKEMNIRAYLNFGHTLGHAIEAELGYGAITHGDAVAVGMRFAILLSEKVYGKNLGYDTFVEWFRSYGYPPFPSSLDCVRLVQMMKKDKKASAGTINMVLMKEIGTVEVQSVADETVLSVLREFQQRERAL